jgi:hypothetical protein
MLQAQINIVQTSFDSGGEVIHANNIEFISSFGEVFCSEIQANNTSISEGFIHNNVFVASGLNDNIEISNISLFPNPTNSVFQINGNASIIKSIKLINNFGKVLINEESEAESLQIDISHFPSGLYFVEIETEKQIKVLKLIKI